MSVSTIIATPAAQILRPEHWDGPGAWWPIFPILWFLVIGGIVTTFVLVSRRSRAQGGQRAGEAVLAQRFATGDIDEQEYRERLTVLKGRTK